jgi:hypothetical protein
MNRGLLHRSDKNLQKIKWQLGQANFLRGLIKSDGGIKDKKRTLPKLNEGGNAL